MEGASAVHLDGCPPVSVARGVRSATGSSRRCEDHGDRLCPFLPFASGDPQPREDRGGLVSGMVLSRTDRTGHYKDPTNESINQSAMIVGCSYDFSPRSGPRLGPGPGLAPALAEYTTRLLEYEVSSLPFPMSWSLFAALCRSMGLKTMALIGRCITA